MCPFAFTSELAAVQRATLESLLYFNPNQQRVREVIEHVIERYVQPRITVEHGLLRESVEGLPDVQSIFALDEMQRLVGAAVLTRIETESIVLLHLALDADYADDGVHASAMLAIRLMAQARAVAPRIRGVRFVSVLYHDQTTRRIPV